MKCGYAYTHICTGREMVGCVIDTFDMEAAWNLTVYLSTYYTIVIS